MKKLLKSGIISIIINIIILIFLIVVIFNVTRTFFYIGRDSMQQEISYRHDDTNDMYIYYLS